MVRAILSMKDIENSEGGCQHRTALLVELFLSSSRLPKWYQFGKHREKGNILSTPNEMNAKMIDH